MSTFQLTNTVRSDPLPKYGKAASAEPTCVGTSSFCLFDLTLVNSSSTAIHPSEGEPGEPILLLADKLWDIKGTAKYRFVKNLFSRLRLGLQCYSLLCTHLGHERSDDISVPDVGDLQHASRAIREDANGEEAGTGSHPLPADIHLHRNALMKAERATILTG